MVQNKTHTTSFTFVNKKYTLPLSLLKIKKIDYLLQFFGVCDTLKKPTVRHCKKANIACSSKCHGKSPESNCVNNDASYNKESDTNEKEHLEKDLEAEKEEEIVEKPKKKTERRKKK